MSACRTAEVHSSPLQVFSLNLSPQIFTHKIKFSTRGRQDAPRGKAGSHQKDRVSSFLERPVMRARQGARRGDPSDPPASGAQLGPVLFCQGQLRLLSLIPAPGALHGRELRRARRDLPGKMKPSGQMGPGRFPPSQTWPHHIPL